MKNIFPSFDSKKSIAENETGILKFWKDNQIFEKSVDRRAKRNEFVFFDGPPFATGTPHYGHILAGAIKDVIPRYKTMQGYRVNRKWGWDCHGVPVEFQVEKEHRIGGKPGIEKMGVGKFNELCRSVVLRCADEWHDTVDRMGRFVNFKDDYKTMDPEFMESVWWVFGELWKKGLIYEGEKVVAYSPKLGSPLSNFEANLNYKDIDDPAVTVKFEIKNTNPGVGSTPGLKEYFLAWTTTPWTLLSNLALAVNPKLEYVKVKNEESGESYWLGTGVLEQYGITNEGEYAEFWNEVERKKGKDLVGKTYLPLFPFFETHKNAFQVLEADYVSAEEGTGIVHQAPNFGEDDAKVCHENDIGLLQNPIDEHGYFNEVIPKLKGKYFRDDTEVEGSVEDNANKWVLDNLGTKLFARNQIRHSYPHCWRTDCALMYRGVKTWFVNIQKIKKTMLDKNQQINWVPEHLKDGRFGKMLIDAPDWAISRNRYWGTPIPVWRCDSCGKIEVMGSRAELEKKVGGNVEDLHKHFVDEMTWECAKCKGGTEITVMRHGQTEWNAEDRWQGTHNTKLTEKGREQAREANAKLGSDFDVVWTSDLGHAIETGKIMAPNAVHIQDVRLREKNYGDLEGLTTKEIYEKYPQFKEKDDIRFSPVPGGKSYEEFLPQVREVLAEIRKKHPGQKILIVTHRVTVCAASEILRGDNLRGEELGNCWHFKTIAKPQMKRIEEVLDCWFESGAMPYASQHYPFANQENNVEIQEVKTKKDWKVFHSIVKAEIFDKFRPEVKYNPEHESFYTPESTSFIFSKNGESLASGRIEKDKNNPKRGFLWNFAVREKYQKRGIGSSVLKLLEDEAPKLKIEEIVFNANPQAVSFYEKNGYQVDFWEGDFSHDKDSIPIGKKIENRKPEFQNEFFLVRHGESENNVLGIESCDPKVEKKFGLTEKGKKQVETNAKKHTDFDIIFTSPFRRTRETAEYFSKTSGVKIIEDARVAELNFGNDGDSYESTDKLIKTHGFSSTPFPKGESANELKSRIIDFFTEINAKYSGKKILVVSHGSPIVVASQWANNKKFKLSCTTGLPNNGEVVPLQKIENRKSEIENFASADFIAEGLDQTRGWFYTLHVLGCALFGKNIFKNVITNGIVLAEDGQKMSKSKKNYPDPNLIFDKYGADAMRFYMLNSPVVRGENFRFSEHGVAEVLKQIILPLRSSYQFFSTYANIDEWQPTKFLFVRHGEGDHNVAHIYSGDVKNEHHLTEKGRAQITETAKHIRNFDVLVASPFIRTQETAEILKKECKFEGEIITDARVQELFFGSLEGEKFLPKTERLANKETEQPASVAKRVNEFMTDMTKQYPGKTIAVTSHGGAVLEAIASANRVPQGGEDYLRVFIPPVGTETVVFAEPVPQTELDKWILSELQTLIEQYKKHFDAYDIEGALKLIPDFIDNLNNWYLRRSRRRFWAPDMSNEKQSGYETLHHVLFMVSKILAPVCPFFAEDMFQKLASGESVHLTFFPFAKTEWQNKKVESKIRLSREIVSLAAGIRARAKVKLRQPLSKLQFVTTEKIDVDLDILREEANVKEIEQLKSVEGLAERVVRVDAKKVGPRLGKKVQELIRKGKSGDFELMKDGRVKIADEVLETNEFEFGFVCSEGVQAEATAQTVVILSTEISDELKLEGFTREVIRAIQELRKKKDFDIADRISIRYATDSAIMKEVFETFESLIAGETLAEEIIHSEVVDQLEEMDIDGESLTLEIAVVE